MKDVRRLGVRRVRQQQRRFVADGPQAVREALGRPELVVEVLATGEAGRRHGDLRARADECGVGWSEVGDDVIAAVTETVTPQGLLAVCHFLDVALDEVLPTDPSLVLVGVDVRDPGNAGTLLRCADAAGADAAVLAGSSVDPYNPKAVRSSAGSLFHLPLCVGPEPAAVIATARAAGLQVLATDGSAATGLDEAEEQGLLARPTAWLVGNEAHGLDSEVRGLADQAVAVPLYGRAESLNLASAAAVCLYASARVQRLAARRGGD